MGTSNNMCGIFFLTFFSVRKSNISHARKLEQLKTIKKQLKATYNPTDIRIVK
jgi:hypothetical protein